MSALNTAGGPPHLGAQREKETYRLARARATSDLMRNNDHAAGTSSSAALAAHEDARALVRLIQCRQCSKPFRLPVTLPCGNSICRQCLPDAHLREGDEKISYPDLPGRRQVFHCPLAGCEEDHPTSECNVDVTLSKVMDSIAELVVRHTSTMNDVVTVMESAIPWDEGISLVPETEKPQIYERHGGRLLATYALAAEGKLDWRHELQYRDSTAAEHALDDAVLADLLEATQREVDCQVCYNVMLDPVTTFCGHTLCRKCFARVLDHSLQCPVCRRDVAVQPSLSDQSSNMTLVRLLNGLCPEIIDERATAYALEERGAEGQCALFVCTLGFPHQSTFLRIFEPRYRLMLRRCLEGNREFGMLMYNRYSEPQGELGPVHFYHYGTMLQILHCQQLPDGTSLVETRGIYRIRVKSYAMLDGYLTGSVERLEDVPIADEERIEVEETSRPQPTEGDSTSNIDAMSTQDLLVLGQDFITRMQGRSASWLQQRVLDIHGQPPNDPALFPYWFASVLPINEEEKYKLLGTTTVRERLKITASWIRRIESQRWYQSNSCRIL
nr:lon peptidase n-terminal domain and ring finger protein c14f5.10c [Quercus suber]